MVMVGSINRRAAEKFSNASLHQCRHQSKSDGCIVMFSLFSDDAEGKTETDDVFIAGSEALYGNDETPSSKSISKYASIISRNSRSSWSASIGCGGAQ